MADIDPDNRPRPLYDAAVKVSASRAAVAAVLTGLAGFGVLSAAQVDAVTALYGALPGLLTLAAGVWSAFGVVAQGEPYVTPTESPAVLVDGEFVALVPDEGRHAAG